MKLVRFVVLAEGGGSKRPEGVFQVALDLRNRNQLAEHERDWLDGAMAWLQQHLRSPEVLRRNGTQRAISWFKPGAGKAIDRVREVAAMLEAHGVRVRMIKTDEPGTVLYEDKWQLVAVPRRRGPAGKI